MGRFYHIDKDNGITYDVWDGVITTEGCFANVRQLFDDPDWPARRRIHLTDMRTITVDIVLDESINTIVTNFCERNAATISNLKVAILGYDIFTKSLGFKDHIIQYPLMMSVFNSLDNACSWLDIDPINAERILKELRQQHNQMNA